MRWAFLASGKKPLFTKATPNMNMPHKTMMAVNLPFNSLDPTLPSDLNALDPMIPSKNSMKIATSGFINIVTLSRVPAAVDLRRPTQKAKTHFGGPECSSYSEGVVPNNSKKRNICLGELIPFDAEMFPPGRLVSHNSSKTLGDNSGRNIDIHMKSIKRHRGAYYSNAAYRATRQLPTGYGY